jgi:hypothetical protein
MAYGRSVQSTAAGTMQNTHSVIPALGLAVKGGDGKTPSQRDPLRDVRTCQSTVARTRHANQVVPSSVVTRPRLSYLNGAMAAS